MEDKTQLLEEKIKHLNDKFESLQEQSTRDRESSDKRMTIMERTVMEAKEHFDRNTNESNTRLIRLEVRFDEFSKSTSDKIDKYAGDVKGFSSKVDLLIDKMNQPKKDSFKEWLTSFGIKLVEMAILWAIAMSFVEKIK